MKAKLSVLFLGIAVAVCAATDDAAGGNQDPTKDIAKCAYGIANGSGASFVRNSSDKGYREVNIKGVPAKVSIRDGYRILYEVQGRVVANFKIELSDSIQFAADRRHVQRHMEDLIENKPAAANVVRSENAGVLVLGVAHPTSRVLAAPNGVYTFIDVKRALIGTLYTFTTPSGDGSGYSASVNHLAKIGQCFDKDSRD
jgi:hypothetical protein